MVFRFKITLDGVKSPQVWRTIDVPASWPFIYFNAAIQAAFGWENCHLWQFSDCMKGYGEGSFRIAEPSEYDGDYSAETLDAWSTKLSDIFPARKTLSFIYDFGDYWRHTIKLVEVIDKNARRAFCQDGKGTCPPEDCGGTGGYEDLKQAFKKENCETESYREWLGLEDNETWDPDRFSKTEANVQLSCIGRYPGAY